MESASVRSAGRSSSLEPSQRSDAGTGIRPISGGWDALTAWRLQETYGPIATAIRSVLATASDGASATDGRTRILLIGAHARILAQFLAHDSAPNSTLPDIVTSGTVDGRLPLSDGEVSCSIAVDWLPAVAPSLRGIAIAEICRVSRHGVVLLHVCDRDDAHRTARAVNDLHRLTHGVDHPSLGRQLE